MRFRILILDGNTKSVNDANIAAGGCATGEGYAKALNSIRGDLECHVHPAADDGGGQLPAGVALKDFDGAAITGSALNFERGGPAIDQQIGLARSAFEAGVPVFGSCWGLQLMAAALGGSVRTNPRGRELFIARNIVRTGAGRDHPLFDGKPQAFDAPAVHSDEVLAVPDGACVLASNEMSDIQAMSVIRGRSHFWGVQYHPEFSLYDLSVILRRYGQRLVDDGLFKSVQDLENFACRAAQLAGDTGDRALAFELGAGRAVLDPDVRLSELRNWLDRVVVGGERTL